MSEFTVPVVRIKDIRKHPNADSLSITEVDGCPVIFRTEDFKKGDFAVYVPVDAVVPTTVPGTEFLGDRPKDRRIRAKRLRGVFSMGLLLPLSTLPGELSARVMEDNRGFEDVASDLGITKYEEPEPGGYNPNSGQKRLKKKLDPGLGPVYDVESYRKYKALFKPEEQVMVTEKIHGMNFRFGWVEDTGLFAKVRAFFTGKKSYKFYFGSHKTWRREDDDSVFSKMVVKYNLKEKTKKFPNRCFYAEIYGDGVQDLKYGCKPGEQKIALFDVYCTDTKKFLTPTLIEWYSTDALEIPMVPILYDGPYDPSVEKMANGKTTIGGEHIREGVVIRSWYEPTQLKLVSEDYLLRKGGTEFH